MSFIYAILFTLFFKINSAAISEEQKTKEDNALISDLFSAIEKDEVDKVEQLIKAGANVNAIGIGRSLRRIGYEFVKEDTYPIFAAIKRRNLTILRTLLTSGANVNVYKAGNTPLIAAISDDYHIDLLKEVVLLLLEFKADINVVNYADRTALDVAQENYRAVLKAEERRIETMQYPFVFPLQSQDDSINKYQEDLKEIIEILKQIRVKQEFEREKQEIIKFLVESGKLIPPIAVITAQYAVSEKEIKQKLFEATTVP